MRHSLLIVNGISSLFCLFCFFETLITVDTRCTTCRVTVRSRLACFCFHLFLFLIPWNSTETMAFKRPVERPSKTSSFFKEAAVIGASSRGLCSRPSEKKREGTVERKKEKNVQRGEKILVGASFHDQVAYESPPAEAASSSSSAPATGGPPVFVPSPRSTGPLANHPQRMK